MYSNSYIKFNKKKYLSEFRFRYIKMLKKLACLTIVIKNDYIVTSFEKITDFGLP